MKKYASDITDNDILIVKGRNVIIDWLYYDQEADIITFLGYFEDNGDEFQSQVYRDKVYTVNLNYRPLVG